MKVIVGIIAFILPVAILALAGAGTWMLIKAKPAVPRAEFEAAPAVCDYIVAEQIASPTWVEAQGSVWPHRTWSLQTEVAGRVAEVHPGLVVGGRVNAGEPLVALDRREFEMAAEQAAAELARAVFEAEVEQGRSIVAEREWALLESTVETTEAGRALALRQPHVRFREAAVKGARATVARRALDLELTTVTAPFNGIVLEEDLEVGQVVTPRMPLARLVCTDEYHVRVSLPSVRLAGIRFAAEGESGSSVDVIQRMEDGTERTWRGEVERLLADVGEAGRQARVVVRIDDPLATSDENGRSTPLLLKAYVTVRIAGPELTGVVAIDRDHLRDDDTVWIVGEDDRLEVRPVEVAARTGGRLLIRGVETGEKLVVSALATAGPGVALAPRLHEEPGR